MEKARALLIYSAISENDFPHASENKLAREPDNFQIFTLFINLITRYVYPRPFFEKLQVGKNRRTTFASISFKLTSNSSVQSFDRNKLCLLALEILCKKRN